MEISTPKGIEMEESEGELPKSEGESIWYVLKLAGFRTGREETAITGARAKSGRTESAVIAGSRTSGIANPSGDAEPG
jgi:hypothetical protein